MSIGTVYQYFPNEEALLLALAERHLDEARRGTAAALRRPREGGVSEEEFFRSFVGFVADSHRSGEPLHGLFFEEAPGSGRLVELAAAINAGCAAEIGGYLRERGLSGGNPSLEAAVLAGVAGNLTHDLGPDPPTGHEPAEYQEQIVRARPAYVGASRAST